MKLTRKEVRKITLSGGSLGNRVVRFRCECNLPFDPIEVDYGEGEGWEFSDYFYIDHNVRLGMVGTAQLIAANHFDIPFYDFECDVDDEYVYE